MKITISQEGYNHVDMTLSLEELNVILDHIGEDQIERVDVTVRKPEAEDEVH